MKELKVFVLPSILLNVLAINPVFVGRGVFPYSLGSNPSISSCSSTNTLTTILEDGTSISDIDQNTNDNSKKIEALVSGLETNSKTGNSRSTGENKVNKSRKITNFSEIKNLKKSSNSLNTSSQDNSKLKTIEKKSDKGMTDSNLITSKDKGISNDNLNLKKHTFSPIQKIKSLFFPNSKFSDDSLDEKESSDFSEEVKPGKYKLLSKTKRNKSKYNNRESEQSNPVKNTSDSKIKDEEPEKIQDQNNYSFIKEFKDSSSNKNENDYLVLINDEFETNYSTPGDKETGNEMNSREVESPTVHEVCKGKDALNAKGIPKKASFDSPDIEFEDPESDLNDVSGESQRNEYRLSIFDKFEEECQRFEDVLLHLSEMTFILNHDGNSSEDSNREDLIEIRNPVINDNNTDTSFDIKTGNDNSLNTSHINDNYTGNNSKSITSHTNENYTNHNSSLNTSQINENNSEIVKTHYIKNQVHTRLVGNKIPLRKFNPKIVNVESGDKGNKIESSKNSVEKSTNSTKGNIPNPIKEPNLKLTIYNEKTGKCDIIYSYYDIEELKRKGIPDIFEKADLKDEFSANENKNPNTLKVNNENKASENLRAGCDRSFDESILYSKVDVKHPQPIESKLFEDNSRADQTKLPKKKKSLLRRIFKFKSEPKTPGNKRKSKNPFKKSKDKEPATVYFE